MRLTDLPLRQPAYVDMIDWSAIPASEGQRLREFGLCEGASVEALNHGRVFFLFGKGPIACRIGRMTIAMRRNHAEAVTVRTGPDAASGEARA